MSNDAVTCKREIAEHKAEYIEFLTTKAIKDFLHKAIVKLVDHEWIAELESKTMGFQHRHPRELIEHLCNTGANLDHLDVMELIKELQKPWDMVEAPATMFATGDHIERQLVKAGPAENPNLHLAFALSNFEASGEYDAAVQEWKAKAPQDKMFPCFRVYIQHEFAMHHKHNKSLAKAVGHGITNMVTQNEVDA